MQSGATCGGACNQESAAAVCCVRRGTLRCAAVVCTRRAALGTEDCPCGSVFPFFFSFSGWGGLSKRQLPQWGGELLFWDGRGERLSLLSCRLECYSRDVSSYTFFFSFLIIIIRLSCHREQGPLLLIGRNLGPPETPPPYLVPRSYRSQLLLWASLSRRTLLWLCPDVRQSGSASTRLVSAVQRFRRAEWFLNRSGLYRTQSWQFPFSGRLRRILLLADIHQLFLWASLLQSVLADGIE